MNFLINYLFSHDLQIKSILVTSECCPQICREVRVVLQVDEGLNISPPDSSHPLGGTVGSFHMWKKHSQLCRCRSDGAKREEAGRVGVWEKNVWKNKVSESQDEHRCKQKGGRC